VINLNKQQTENRCRTTLSQSGARTKKRSAPKMYYASETKRLESDLG
jgi:hypothetical protein